MPLILIIFNIKVLQIKTNHYQSINDHKNQGEWLAIVISFISSNDPDETRIMHSKSDSIEIMIGNKTDQIIEELLETLLQRYQEGLEGK